LSTGGVDPPVHFRARVARAICLPSLRWVTIGA
jgi:hypothetical protein